MVLADLLSMVSGDWACCSPTGRKKPPRRVCMSRAPPASVRNCSSIGDRAVERKKTLDVGDARVDQVVLSSFDERSMTHIEHDDVEHAHQAHHHHHHHHHAQRLAQERRDSERNQKVNQKALERCEQRLWQSLRSERHGDALSNELVKRLSTEWELSKSAHVMGRRTSDAFNALSGSGGNTAHRRLSNSSMSSCSISEKDAAHLDGVTMRCLENPNAPEKLLDEAYDHARRKMSTISVDSLDAPRRHSARMCQEVSSYQSAMASKLHQLGAVELDPFRDTSDPAHAVCDAVARYHQHCYDQKTFYPLPTLGDSIDGEMRDMETLDQEESQQLKSFLTILSQTSMAGVVA